MTTNTVTDFKSKLANMMAEAQTQYRQLVTDCAQGGEYSQEDAPVLSAANKTLDHLEADVTRMQSRFALRQQLDAFDSDQHAAKTQELATEISEAAERVQHLREQLRHAEAHATGLHTQRHSLEKDAYFDQQQTTKDLRATAIRATWSDETAMQRRGLFGSDPATVRLFITEYHHTGETLFRQMD